MMFYIMIVNLKPLNYTDKRTRKSVNKGVMTNEQA